MKWLRNGVEGMMKVVKGKGEQEGYYSINELQYVMEQESRILQFKMKAQVQSRDPARINAANNEEEKEEINKAKVAAP